MHDYKIVAAADFHLKNSNLKDKTKALKQLSEYIYKNNIDLFVDLGDSFDTPNPDEETRMVYSDFLNSIPLDCEIIKLGGNHETRDNKIYAYESSMMYNLYAEDNVREITYVKTFHQKAINGCDLFFCNYGHQHFLDRNKPLGNHSQYLFAHLTVNGSKINENYVLRNDGVNSEIFKPFTFTFLGDIHKRQMYDNWGYVGALTKNNFGESENTDGFSVITIHRIDEHTPVDSPFFTEEFIPLHDVREYEVYHMHEDMTGQDEYTEFLFSKVTDNYVKVIIEGSSEWIASLDRQALIKGFEDRNPHRLSFQWNTTDTRERKSISHNKTEEEQLSEYIEKNKVNENVAEDGKKILIDVINQ